MPPKKSDCSNFAGFPFGFEAKLWLTADKLRNNMDAAECKPDWQPKVTELGPLTFEQQRKFVKDNGLFAVGLAQFETALDWQLVKAELEGNPSPWTNC